MYAMITDEAISSAVDFKTNKAQELHYWRKHPNLHGWMSDVYYAKGGSADDFNFLPVVITIEDLDRLETCIRNGSLPPTSGFFFGESDGTEQDDDLAFIQKSREAIAAGFTVYYEAGW